ncbi:MAG: ABC transporter ATP-binding protein [Prevotella sp.]|jgi:lipopolysaccharide transport system ATP-binding protein|nr:ABC transporter ATP-binding protein [Prevotella sp.]
MSDIAIKFENISKQYRLGLVGTGTITHDLNRWWHVVRGKEDPYLKIGEVNDRSSKASSKYIWALKDISFDVRQGEVLGIIGKNGAGKSTLLKILSRVTSPSTGSIKAKGRIASLLEVGTGFHPEMTGRENIFMNGSIMGMNKSEIKRKLDEIVDFAGVEKYIDTPVKRYSSGMTVRLGFAIAAHLEPEILVVDEVLAVGDAEFQKKAIGKMQDVSRGEGRTVLFVSHNMGAVEALCTNGVVLENGLVSYAGSVENSIEYYLKNDSFSEEKIISGIEYCHPGIKIDSITINNSESNIINIDEKNTELNIVIEGENYSEKTMSLGLVLYDYRKVRLGVFSPGHIKAENERYEKGHFKIEETIHLPQNMTKGNFFLGISLHQPNIELFLNIPDFVKIISKGKIGITGLEFEYKDNGFLILE